MAVHNGSSNVLVACHLRAQLLNPHHALWQAGCINATWAPPWLCFRLKRLHFHCRLKGSGGTHLHYMSLLASVEHQACYGNSRSRGGGPGYTRTLRPLLTSLAKAYQRIGQINNLGARCTAEVWMSSHSWFGSQWPSWPLCVKGPVQEPQNDSIVPLSLGCLITQHQLCEEVHSGSGPPESGQLILFFHLGALFNGWAISPARQLILNKCIAAREWS